jgi:hypothetical protein
MARFSSGLRNALAVNYGLGIMMNAGIIRVYGGVLPDTPDDPPNAIELARITTEGKVFIPGNDTVGAGLLLTHVSPGGLINAGEWRMKGVSTGTATWWRWCWSQADPLTFSEIYPRVDGSVGTELQINVTAITPSTDIEIQQFLFVLPMG